MQSNFKAIEIKSELMPNQPLERTDLRAACSGAAQPHVGLREERALAKAESATEGERGILGSYSKSGGACEVPHSH